MDAKNDDSAGSDSLDKSLQKKCVVDDVGQGEGVKDAGEPEASTSERPEHAAKKHKTEKYVGDGSVNVIEAGAATSLLPADRPEEDAQKTSTSNSTSTTMNNNNNAFETKVKQISKNLKETTLAETASKKTSLEDTTSSSSSSSESENPSCSMHASNNDHDLEVESSLTSINESLDDQDQRSKKVHFHPDVKENDGGNRVIPKKKKKLKNATGADDAGLTGSRSGTDEEMNFEEEDDLEDEEEFDLAKTIAEAQDYLKDHPLTFVRPHQKGGLPMKNGLLEAEDLPQLAESSEEEDFYENVAPENGIERILGKQIKCGGVEYMLRYADRPGLFWEKEEFILRECPGLLAKYEQNRERRQERLMRHVAKRQNVRQRYTDF